MAEAEKNETDEPEAEGLPLTGFICHLTDRKKARQAITKLANAQGDAELSMTLKELPLRTQAGVKKNWLQAMSDDQPIVLVCLKTGEAVHL